LWARMDWPSLRRGYRRMRRQSVSQQRHVPASSANVQTDFWVRRQQFNPILVSRTKCWKFFVFKNLGERCEVNRDDCLPDLCRITERVSIKWPITLAFFPVEFMGRHCEQDFDACSSLPCKNGASCITTRPQSNFYCECLPGKFKII
jgi:hypothetical protein